MASFSDQFSSALGYERYLATGTGEQQRRWTQIYDIARLDATQQQLIAGFQREMKTCSVSRFVPTSPSPLL
jgi:hypothetical protein